MATLRGWPDYMPAQSYPPWRPFISECRLTPGVPPCWTNLRSQKRTSCRLFLGKTLPSNAEGNFYGNRQCLLGYQAAHPLWRHTGDINCYTYPLALAGGFRARIPVAVTIAIRTPAQRVN